MQEDVLRKFFKGEVTAAELSKDIQGTAKRFGGIVSVQSIEEMEGEQEVTRPMLVALCDAVLQGGLSPEALSDIGLALVQSDHFVWDAEEDELLGDVIYDWSEPEMNYPLTAENVLRCRSWLLNETPYSKDDD